MPLRCAAILRDAALRTAPQDEHRTELTLILRSAPTARVSKDGRKGSLA